MSEKIYLEHANITVSNLEAAVAFFQTAFPAFKVRGGGEESVENGVKRWLHLGTKETYVALSQPPVELKHSGKDYSKNGYNHIGFVVEDATSLAERLSNKGYQRTYPRQEEPSRIREYFGDPDGNEIEFVQYLSDAWEKRNDYHDHEE